MRRRRHTAAAALLSLALLATACGGGGDDDDKVSTNASTSSTVGGSTTTSTVDPSATTTTVEAGPDTTEASGGPGTRLAPPRPETAPPATAPPGPVALGLPLRAGPLHHQRRDQLRRRRPPLPGQHHQRHRSPTGTVGCTRNLGAGGTGSQATYTFDYRPDGLYLVSLVLTVTYNGVAYPLPLTPPTPALFLATGATTGASQTLAVPSANGPATVVVTVLGTEPVTVGDQHARHPHRPLRGHLPAGRPGPGLADAAHQPRPGVPAVGAGAGHGRRRRLRSPVTTTTWPPSSRSRPGRGPSGSSSASRTRTYRSSASSGVSAMQTTPILPPPVARPAGEG